MNELTVMTNKATMSSHEIAVLTGKEHGHVMRDIRKMLAELYPNMDSLENKGIFIVISENGQTERIELPKREALILTSGYSIKQRAAIIDRWQELESMQVKTPLQLAREQVALYEQLEATQALLSNAIQTKAEIGTRREATAMNTASQAVKKAASLEIELDKSKSYSTIKRMEMLHHGIHFNWRILKSAGTQMGIESIDVFDANYGTIKAYHRDVWLEAYAIDIN